MLEQYERLASRKGVEPLAYGLRVRRSAWLSYRPILFTDVMPPYVFAQYIRFGLSTIYDQLKEEKTISCEGVYICFTTQLCSPMISTMSLLSGLCTITCPFFRYGIRFSYSFLTFSAPMAASFVRLRMMRVLTCLNTVSSIS